MKMRAFFLLSAAVLTGCSAALYRRERVAVDPDVAPAGYISDLEEPLARVDSGFVLDGGSSGVEIEDARGRVARIWWDQSGLHQEGFRKAGCTWYGRDFGEIVLGSLLSGRSLILPSDEASRLLRILEEAQKTHLDEDDDFTYFINDIRMKIKRGPIKSPQPTTYGFASGRG